jgi:hypothetical protein
MSQRQDRYGYGYGYGDYGRAYYRGRRRPRSPFGDIKLASLGKMYADVPVDAVTKAMEGLNLQYKENRDAQDKYQAALANAQVMAGDDPEKQRLIKEIQGRVDQFVQDTGGAYEKGDDFVRGLARDVVANPWLAQAIQNRTKFDEDQKTIDKMRVEGLAPLYYAPENFTTMGLDGSPQQYSSYIGSQVNRKPLLESYFENLKSERVDLIDEMMNITTVQGVSPERINAKVNSIVNETFDLLSNTKEYQQDLENEKARVKNQGGTWDDAMQTQYDNRWKQQLNEVGQEFAYRQVSENPNRALFNAMLKDQNTSGPSALELDFQTDLSQSSAGRTISATDHDRNWTGLFAGDDPYDFYATRSITNPTYKEVDSNGTYIPNSRIFNQPVVDLTSTREDGSWGSKEAIVDYKNRNKNYFTASTGEAVQVPITVGSENSFYNSLEDEIADSFAAQGYAVKAKPGEKQDEQGFKLDSDGDRIPLWGMNTQNMGGEVMYSGSLSTSGPRWGDNINTKPVTLSVTFQAPDSEGKMQEYVQPITYVVNQSTGLPMIVEDASMMVHNNYKKDGDEFEADGQVLVGLSPTQAANYGMKSSYRMLDVDKNGQVSGLGNLESDLQTIGKYVQLLQSQGQNDKAMQVYNQAVQLNNIRNKFLENNGNIDAADYRMIRLIEQNLMPEIFKLQNPDALSDKDLSKTKNNALRN